MPIPPYVRPPREKVFGPGRAVPLDRNAKARIVVYARARSAQHKEARQHKGPITRAFLEVLEAMLWGFHNARSGCCFPSYESIAARAECARSTVAEALKALEWAGVLTWQNRIAYSLVRERDLFGRWASRRKQHRTYPDPEIVLWRQFRDGQAALTSAGYCALSYQFPPLPPPP